MTAGARMVPRMKAKVAERGQVTIPEVLRKKVDLALATMLEFEADDERLVAVKVQPRRGGDAVFGTASRASAAG